MTHTKKTNKIPKNHIDNMNKLKDIIRNFEFTNIAEFEVMCNEYIKIYDKLPQYLQSKEYLLEFNNNCYGFISHIKFICDNLSKAQKRFIEFDKRMEQFRNACKNNQNLSS